MMSRKREEGGMEMASKRMGDSFCDLFVLSVDVGVFVAFANREDGSLLGVYFTLIRRNCNFCH